MGTISLYIIVTWLYNVASIATWVYYNCNCVCTFCSPGARKVAPAGTKSLARKLTAVWIVPLCVWSGWVGVKVLCVCGEWVGGGEGIVCVWGVDGWGEGIVCVWVGGWVKALSVQY